MTSPAQRDSIAAGHAALSICEALLDALIERELLTESDVADLLGDAADTHRAASKLESDREFHERVAVIIENVAAKKKSAAEAASEAGRIPLVRGVGTPRRA
jgi:hypothetical protein